MKKFTFESMSSVFLAVCLLLITTGNSHARVTLDFSGAEIYPVSADQVNTAKFLQEEIFKRTGISLQVTDNMPPGPVPVIVLGLEDDMPVPRGISVPAREESYALWMDTLSGSNPVIQVRGRDKRGILFGAGRLLQVLYLSENYISVPLPLKLASSPADRVRAHQIITNTQCEDGFMEWDNESDVKQFVNDMLIFGTNGFEPTVPELVDDYLEYMNIDLYIKLTCQEIIDLNSRPDNEIMSFFDHLEGIDHITTYGGDARGSVKPQLFFPHMDRVLPLLLRGQPGVKWWYSNQCLDDHAQDYDEYIFTYIKEKKPSWLYGLVYGPWTKRGMPEIREELPGKYELRHFPETCHPRWCQYPVPEWDRTWAIVWPRNQSIYAMPSMMLDIYNAGRKHTIGSLPYSHTGVYNDLNKFVWSAAGWNPEISSDSILKAYAKVFIAHDFLRHPDRPGEVKAGSVPERIDAAAKTVADGLRLLEHNWTGSLKDNTSTEEALKTWKLIAECIGGAEKNWRVEMFLAKARIDAQVKRKYDLEMQAEDRALQILNDLDKSKLNPGNSNLKKAIKNAKAVLAVPEKNFQSKEEFLRECRNMGISEKFGDLELIADNIYTSFNDRYWIEEGLEKAESREKQGADQYLSQILNYENAGEGGFYDNLGLAGEQPHLVRQHSWKEDPGFVHSPIEWVDNKADSRLRHSQHTHALARYDTPLVMRWNQLDKKAAYEIKVVYNGPFDCRIRCQTGEGLLIHPFMDKEGSSIMRFDIPLEASRDGSLELQWILEDDNVARGVSVSEIWLSKKQ